MKSILLVASLVVGSIVTLTAASPGEQATAGSPAVRAFVEQVNREWPRESDRQTATVESLQLLASAIESVAEARRLVTPQMRTDLHHLHSEAQKYGGSKPVGLEQSKHLKRIFVQAAEILGRLSEGAGVQGEVQPRLAAIGRSAAALDAEQPPRRQPDVIERFFHQAAEILRHIDSH